MRPANLKTRVFLDGGDPQEIREVISLLGFLDGQTTNPTTIAKNPKVAERLKQGIKFTSQEIFDFYQNIAKEISQLIPDGSVSIEVYADSNTTGEKMFEMGKEMFGWIPNAHIKYPTTKEGLKAAYMSIKEGIRVNMTLCFSQSQAAAVYAATKGAKRGQVFISPFIGRLDDIGLSGMDLIKNIIEMYKESDGHVEVLAASIRDVNHLRAVLSLDVDIVTAPAKVLKEWAESGLKFTDHFNYTENNLSDIPYEELDLNRDWHEFNINHKLTESGIEKFSNDWNALI